MRAEKGLATIAVVGENMKHVPGIAGKLFGTLGRSGISVIACARVHLRQTFRSLSTACICANHSMFSMIRSFFLNTTYLTFLYAVLAQLAANL